MSDHDFEKRVKQKMDELKFTPSDAVWQAVQMEIRKDKPRRRGWILIPLLVAGLVSAGYFIFNDHKSGLYSSNQKHNPTNETESPVSASSKVADRNASASSATGDLAIDILPEAGPDHDVSSGPSVPMPAVEAGNGEKTKEGNSEPGNAGNDQKTNAENDQKTNAENNGATRAGNSEKKNVLNPGLQETQQSTSAGFLTDVKKPATNNKNSTGNMSKTAPVLIAGQANLPVETQTALPQSSGTKQQQSSTTKQQPDLYTHDSLGQVAIVADQQKLVSQDSTAVAKPQVSTALNPDSATATVSKLVKSRKNKKRWDWGLNISGGVSNINDGSLTGVLKSSSMADAASNAQSSGNSNFLFTPSISGMPPARSSEVNAGPYISVGGFVTKQLSRTFSFTAGLQYSQFNTIIKVGYRVDSSRLVNNGSQIMNVARYYRADENSKFSNKYHFIELPLTLSTRITGNKSIPVFWNAGVHLSQLVGSNALVFDSGTGVYYQDKSTLNKTQLGFSTGFTFGLFGKTKVPMLLGPTVRYNASQMFNKDILKGNHLISAGIDLKILLNKK